MVSIAGLFLGVTGQVAMRKLHQQSDLSGRLDIFMASVRKLSL